MQDVRWYRNDRLLNESLPHLTLEFGVLVLNKPTSEDSGYYQCVASNEAGSLRSDLYRVQIENDQSENANRRIICKYQSGKSIEGNEMKSANESRGDEAVLWCRNKHSIQPRKIRRSADDGGDLPPESLRQVNRKSLKVNETEIAVINCDLKQSDKKSGDISVVWKKDEKTIKQVQLSGRQPSEPVEGGLFESSMFREENRIVVDKKNGSLIIASTIPSDTGTYECYVHKNTKAPPSTPVTINELMIIEKLKFVPQPTSKRLEIGNVGKVHCKVQGTPAPQVKWFKVCILDVSL